MAQPLRDSGAFLALLGRYLISVMPHAEKEFRRLRGRAEAIPDPVLRDRALSAFQEESWMLKGAAIFATLAPRSSLAPTARLTVALQAMYQYLDALGEQDVPYPLRDGLHLHLSLTEALDPDAPIADHYRHHPQWDDGGYLTGLITTCREYLRMLPSAAAIRPTALRAATRCGEGQSHTHASISEGTERLAAWSSAQGGADDCMWWEVAAGAISSVALHALLAAAGDPRTTADDAARIEAAYFPSICAITTLLDSVIDRADDSATGNHNTSAHYPAASIARDRLAWFARRADADVRALPHGERHAAILRVIVAGYLTAPGADDAYARPILSGIRDDLKSLSPALAVMRLRRRTGAEFANPARG